MSQSVEIVIKDLSERYDRMGYAWNVVGKALAAGEVLVTLSRPKRSLDQNAKLWAMLSDVSRCVEWYGRKLSNEDWKHVFTAALKQQEAVPGINGGFVVLGQSTRAMRKREFADLIELIYAFGSEHNVVWSERSQAVCDEYRQWMEQQEGRAA
ncbi:MAG: recombination protein NinB [Pontibacterium sp.]